MNPDPDTTRTANRHDTGGLPAIEEHDLPQGRHQFHKERLMSQIHDDRRTAARPARNNPFLRKAILLSAATALAGALAVGVLALTPGDSDRPVDRATGPALTTSLGVVDAKGAPRLLDRISLAAAGAEVPNARAGQYVYIETRSANTYVKTVGGESSLVSYPCTPGSPGGRPTASGAG